MSDTDSRQEEEESNNNDNDAYGRQIKECPEHCLMCVKASNRAGDEWVNIRLRLFILCSSKAAGCYHPCREYHLITSSIKADYAAVCTMLCVCTCVCVCVCEHRRVCVCE